MTGTETLLGGEHEPRTSGGLAMTCGAWPTRGAPQRGQIS